MGTRILLVDDNEDFLDSTKDVLEEEGYQVTTARSGEGALIQVVSAPFDVVIMDIKMPGMNGVESFIEMKRLRPDLRVILVTAYSVASLVTQAIDEGVCAVLNKPLNMGMLFSTVEKAKTTGTGGLILVADDDCDFCENLVDVLTGEGFRVVAAHDGEEAVRQGENIPFDVLLIDMKLPALNGLEAYRRIKRSKPDMVAIFISGYAVEMDILIRQALDEKALCFLGKPIDMVQLLKLLKNNCTDGHASTH
ncbi:response regulator [Geobacter sp. SVR]|uniref:response regulator n=1 Tax=Geobacter sp. SVR TaxID=2495594 RepID=UPI00143F04D0|nr:response regulator [Geobacter sp. SVR]BCS53007.1 hypothetical protein GSVR_13150 [Geobacter sp. SVR]GCF84392.1 response regulator [Geobacter sp. SVR]